MGRIRRRDSGSIKYFKQGNEDTGDEAKDEENDSFTSDEQRLPDNIKAVKFEEDELDADQKLKKLMGENIKLQKKNVIKFEIKDYGVDWFTFNDENPNGLIPSTITYYDNDDGYWDHWIKTKRERAGLPEISSRPYFKH